jgi:hypothetical protein
MGAIASSPTAPIMRVVTPARAAASACRTDHVSALPLLALPYLHSHAGLTWLAPLPPGAEVNPEHSTVSPRVGRRGGRHTRSTISEPKTVTLIARGAPSARRSQREADSSATPDLVEGAGVRKAHSPQPSLRGTVTRSEAHATETGTRARHSAGTRPALALFARGQHWLSSRGVRGAR